MKTLITILFLLISLVTSSQISFNKAYGSNGVDRGQNIVQDENNRYYIVGSTSSSSTGNTDILVLCIDENGDEVWSRYYGTSETDKGTDIIITPDNHLLVLGFTNGMGAGGYDVYLTKLTLDGDPVWEKTFGGSDWDFAYNIESDDLGDYLLLGETYSYGSGNNDAYLIKVTDDGALIWDNTYGTSGNELARNLKIDENQNIVFIGDQKLESESTYNAWMVKLNPLGDILWERIHSVSDGVDEYGQDLLIRDGEIIGLSNLPDNIDLGTTSSRWKINSANEIVWDLDEIVSQIMYGLLSTTDTTFIVVGRSYLNNNAFWFYLSDNGYQEEDNGGDQEFDTNFGYDSFYSAIKTNDGGFIIVGETDIDNEGHFSVLVTKFYSLIAPVDVEITNFVLRVESNSKTKFISFYPNPAYNNINFNLTQKGEYKVIIRNLSGKIILEDWIQNNSLNIDNLTDGMYVIEMYNSSQYIGSQKLIKQ